MNIIYTYWKTCVGRNDKNKSGKLCKTIKKQYLEEVLSNISSSIENDDSRELKEYLSKLTIVYEKNTNNIIDLILKVLYDIEHDNKLNMQVIIDDIPEMTSDIIVGLCLNIIFDYYKKVKKESVEQIMGEKLYNMCMTKINKTLDLYG